MNVETTIKVAEVADEELLNRFLSGDRLALDELFQRHRDLAYRVAFRLLGHEADALDAVQQGFVKALVHLDRFRGRSSFKTWLLRVVTNASLDLGRQRGRREVLKQAAPARWGYRTEQTSLADNPAADLERAELRAILQEALATLPESQRQTFVLHTEADLNYREVAEVLGISIGTVMSRLYYARQKLRAFLGRRHQDL